MHFGCRARLYCVWGEPESVRGFVSLNVHLGPIRGKLPDPVTLGDTGSSRACRHPQGLMLCLLHSPLPRVLGRGPPGVLPQRHSPAAAAEAGGGPHGQPGGRVSRSGGQAVTRAGAAARTWSWSSFTTKSAPGAWTSWRDTGKAPPALRTCLVPWALQNLPVPPHPCSPELPRGGGHKPLFPWPQKHTKTVVYCLSHKPLAERDIPTVLSLIPVCRVITCVAPWVPVTPPSNPRRGLEPQTHPQETSGAMSS